MFIKYEMLWSNLCLTVFWLIQSSILIRNIWVSALSGPVLVVGEQWQIKQQSSSSSAVDYFVWGDNRTHVRTTQSQLWEGLQRASIGAVRGRNRGFLWRGVVSGKNGLLEKAVLRLRPEEYVGGGPVVLAELWHVQAMKSVCHVWGTKGRPDWLQ